MAPAGLLVLRVTIAAVLAVHASNWLFGSFGDSALGPGGLTVMTTYFASAGISHAFLFVVVTGGAQLAGSLLLMPGLFSRVAAGVLLVVELAKVSVDSARWGFFLNWSLDPTRGHGMEFGLVLMAGLTCLLLSGAGEWSVDAIRHRSRESRSAGLARIRERV